MITNVFKQVNMISIHEKLTVNMSKSTEDSSRTVSSLLNVVTFTTFVNFWMKLLLSASVAILTGVSTLAVARLAPFITVLHVRTCRRSDNIHIFIIISVVVVKVSRWFSRASIEHLNMPNVYITN